MSSQDLFTVVGLILAVFTGLVWYILKFKDTASLRNEEIRNDILSKHEASRDAKFEKTMTLIWGKVDTNNARIDDLKDYVNTKYHNKDDVEKYVNLVNMPILTKLDNVNLRISEIKEMILAMKEAS